VYKGNSTLGIELSHLRQPIDIIVAPIGGGGLTSGIIKGVKIAKQQEHIKVVAAEPVVRRK
jgi:threonine dehydratase